MNTKTTEISRRKFMALAGGTLGFAAFAAAGIDTGKAYGSSKPPDQPKVCVDKLQIQTTEAQVLVVGGGMAGVFAAVKAHDRGAKFFQGKRCGSLHWCRWV